MKKPLLRFLLGLSLFLVPLAAKAVLPALALAAPWVIEEAAVIGQVAVTTAANDAVIMEAVAAAAPTVSATWSGIVNTLGAAVAYFTSQGAADKYDFILDRSSYVAHAQFGAFQFDPADLNSSKIADLFTVANNLNAYVAANFAGPTNPFTVVYKDFTIAAGAVPDHLERVYYLTNSVAFIVNVDPASPDSISCSHLVSAVDPVPTNGGCFAFQQKEQIDHIKRLSRGPSGFVPDLTDPDWGGSLPAGANAGGGPVAVSGTANGQPFRTTYSVDAYGRIHVDQAVQTAADAQGTPQVTTKAATFNSTGTLNQYQEATRQGITINDSSVTNNYYNTPSTGDTTNNVTVNFPDDYARDATVAGLSLYAGQMVNQQNLTNQKLDQIHQDLSVDPTTFDPAPLNSRTNNEIKGLLPDSSFSGLLGWQLPAHASECPTIAFSTWFGSFSTDAHCQLVQQNFGILSAVMYAAWSITALFVVLKA